MHKLSILKDDGRFTKGSMLIYMALGFALLRNNLPQRRGNYVLTKSGEQMITIGRGMAEKVWVEQ